MEHIIYILIAMIVVGAFLGILRLFKIKVWINVKTKRYPSARIGFMEDKGRQSVPEVRLIGKSKGTPIGRVCMGDGSDDNAYVELLISDSNDDSIKPQYRTYGFITQEGKIYKRPNNKRKPELIGYTARPSAPNVPTVVGERKWYTLWLCCKLNAYQGAPEESSAKEQNRESVPNKTSDKKQKKATKIKPYIASCSYTGIHSSKYDAMPPEARSAAYGVFFTMYNKNDYTEYYNSPAYGWKDTALLASFIYALAYVVWYFIKTQILNQNFMSNSQLFDSRIYAVLLFGLYFALWAVVRALKIECIENSNTIQPKIDLFNKALRQRFYDISILGCCAVLLFVLYDYYDYNFVPLALAIFTGVIVNMRLVSASSRWEIKNPYSDDDDPDKDNQDEIANPDGDISRTYQWTLDSDSVKGVSGELALYFNSQYISDLRFANPFFDQRNDLPVREQILNMFHYIKEHRSISARLRYVVSQINKLAKDNCLSDEDTIQFALDFVQEPNIRYTLNRDSKAINRLENYIRFPDETLYDKEADSNSKALLAAMLFHYMKYNVLFLYSRIQNHGAIGIRVSQEWLERGVLCGKNIKDITFHYNNADYIFCETTSDAFRIGGTMNGMKPDDFNEKILFSLTDNDVDDSNEDTETCLYTWTLDSELGNKLQGQFQLEFDLQKIANLREHNPFNTYGLDGHSYEDNIKAIFDYITDDDTRMDDVNNLAMYIKKRISDAKLPELDLVQFALDFCQAPNITYRIDEESAKINYAKEYMRFPNEVLYDKEGDCDCKSSLTAALFHELGYKVIIMLSQKLAHAAIGVECKDDWLQVINPQDEDKVVREYNGTKYIYCETTGDGFRVGHIKENESIQDFETIVEIEL
jgi:hypothetical protein